jgi:hypothetical protein
MSTTETDRTAMPATLLETAATGGRTMPISMTVTEPARACTEEQLEHAMFPGAGLNVAFIAGTLSGFLAHERAGACLYRVAREHSDNPMLTGKYEEFGRETIEHIAIYEELVTDLGGDPHYVSPAARMIEQQGAKLLEGPVSLAGSVGLVSLETAFLEAVVSPSTSATTTGSCLPASPPTCPTKPPPPCVPRSPASNPKRTNTSAGPPTPGSSSPPPTPPTRPPEDSPDSSNGPPTRSRMRSASAGAAGARRPVDAHGGFHRHGLIDDAAER